MDTDEIGIAPLLCNASLKGNANVRTGPTNGPAGRPGNRLEHIRETGANTHARYRIVRLGENSSPVRPPLTPASQKRDFAQSHRETSLQFRRLVCTGPKRFRRNSRGEFHEQQIQKSARNDGRQRRPRCCGRCDHAGRCRLRCMRIDEGQRLCCMRCLWRLRRQEKESRLRRVWCMRRLWCQKDQLTRFPFAGGRRFPATPAGAPCSLSPLPVRLPRKMNCLGRCDG